jgi:hypothetical protein
LTTLFKEILFVIADKLGLFQQRIDACHLLLYGKASLDGSGCHIADIVKRALVEVFDVMETKISGRQWSCGSLSEMKGIFIDEGFILR